jgi:hypothetical protein
VASGDDATARSQSAPCSRVYARNPSTPATRRADG